ncbi:MAG: four helix bundle protein [Planctomycetes bacterium]|nr:four helix bundle protein [Planctomycetota bacterium]
MGTIRRFEDLEIWQEARELVRFIHEVTAGFSFDRDEVFRGDFRITSRSVMSNIAEGFERTSKRQFIQFLVIARGSAAELRSLLHEAFDRRKLHLSTYRDAMERCDRIRRRISALIKYLQRDMANMDGRSANERRNQ